MKMKSERSELNNFIRHRCVNGRYTQLCVSFNIHLSNITFYLFVTFASWHFNPRIH